LLAQLMVAFLDIGSDQSRPIPLLRIQLEARLAIGASQHPSNAALG
jgi:hypothetical protein